MYFAIFHWIVWTATVRCRGRSPPSSRRRVHRYCSPLYLPWEYDEMNALKCNCLYSCKVHAFSMILVFVTMLLVSNRRNVPEEQCRPIFTMEARLGIPSLLALGGSGEFGPEKCVCVPQNSVEIERHSRITQLSLVCAQSLHRAESSRPQRPRSASFVSRADSAFFFTCLASKIFRQFYRVESSLLGKSGVRANNVSVKFPTIQRQKDMGKKKQVRKFGEVKRMLNPKDTRLYVLSYRKIACI